VRVLVACEFSGIVRRAFRERGHDAWSCDLLPAEDESPFHFHGDALVVSRMPCWDLMIAHPPCTYLARVGAPHMHKPGRKEAREEAMAFFMALWNAPIERICIENPEGYPRRAFRAPDQVINPFEFGHGERKKTLLWLKNLPPLFATDIRNPDPPHHVMDNGKKVYWTHVSHDGRPDVQSPCRRLPRRCLLPLAGVERSALPRQLFSPDSLDGRAAHS
jgi:hypothetical protein